MKQPVATLWFSYQIREERERLQLRYNELGLSLVTAQEELTEARTLAGANAVATASMARQIEVLVADQVQRRQELDGLRRQLEASTTSALDAQSRLQAYSDRSGRPSMTPSGPVGTPLTRATATPLSGVTTQPLPDPISFMYAGSGDRGHRDDSEDRPQRSSSRRSRDRDDASRDRSHRSSGSRRSRDRDGFSEDRSHRSSRPGRSREREEYKDDRSERFGRSSRPTSSSSSSSTPAWLTRPGQGMAAFPGSRWTNSGNPEQTSMAKILKFATVETPRLTRKDLNSASVAKFISYIHNLRRGNAFDDSVMQMLMDRDVITLLGFYFGPSETARRHPINGHWTTDWDVATIIQALEELFPLRPEERHLATSSRWQQVVIDARKRARILTSDLETPSSNGARQRTG